MAGSGPWEVRYKDLGPRVLVLGSMSPSKLQAFYNAIDVFVNPTLRPQGLDLTLMEAMMSGKPVMASRFHSIKGSIVVDDEFGFMFAPNVASLLEALELAVKEGSRSLNNFSRKILVLLHGNYFPLASDTELASNVSNHVVIESEPPSLTRASGAHIYEIHERQGPDAIKPSFV
ncbi:hypothetical protein ACLB2K_032024 [Fragaria x ananassa]